MVDDPPRSPKRVVSLFGVDNVPAINDRSKSARQELAALKSLLLVPMILLEMLRCEESELFAKKIGVVIQKR